MGVRTARDDTFHGKIREEQAAMETPRISPTNPAISKLAFSEESPLEYQLKAEFVEHDPRTIFPFLEYAVAALFYHAEQAEQHHTAQAQLMSGLSGPSAWTFQRRLSFARIFQKVEHEHTTILEVVAVRNMLSAVNYILEDTIYERQPPNLDGALQAVAKVGHLEVAQRLLKAGANPRGSTGLGTNALHIGCEYGHSSVVYTLLANGADVESSNVFGWRALHWACEKGHPDVLQLLLNAHADIEAKTQDGESALLIATRTGNMAIFNMLLSAKAMIEVSDHFGRTPVHQAVRFHHNAIVRILLNQNINLIAHDTAGFTVLDVARNRWNKEAGRMLVAKGARYSKERARWMSLSHSLFRDIPDDLPDRTMTASPLPSHRPASRSPYPIQRLFSGSP